ncbi:MAG: hypothetical protein ABI591_31820 [Kofleriaceae bacterium]
MSRSHYLLAISLFAAGCSDDANTCGSPGSSPFGLTVSSDQVNLVYGGLTASENNDCPAMDAPAGVISVTINGTQMSSIAGAGLITLCIPRPDLLGAQVQLGTDVKLVDLDGMDDTCNYSLDLGHVPTGTVQGVGVCANGGDKAGFGLIFSGFIGLRRTCATAIDSVSVGITGNVAVNPI